MDRKTYVENNDFDSSLGDYLEHFSRLGYELIKGEDSVRRVTYEAIYAKCCDPVYNASAMDGIAVFSENTAMASDNAPLTLHKGRDFCYVNTGNLIPSEYDSVIMIEDVLIMDDDTVRILSPSRPWQHVRVVGESVVATEMILPRNRRIRPIDIGAILASGNDLIKVVRQPKVAIIPTGSEMVESYEELQIGKLRESNTRVFSALTEEYGGIPDRLPIIEDNPEMLETVLEKAVKTHDMVVINAGSSAGTKDFTAGIIAKLGKVYTHGLNVKPGKPTILGEISGKPVIGVPGYPVSAYLIYEKAVKRIIYKLLGLSGSDSLRIQAKLTKRVTSSLKNTEFIRVAMGEVNNIPVATPLERGAAAVMSMVKADGILTVPLNSEGIEAGEIVDVELLKPYAEIKKSLVIVGSHDMIIDIIGDRIPVSSAHVGSLSGIMALKNNACNVAPIHLLDENGGQYNIPFVKKYFPDKKMALIKGVGRTQGLLVQKHNPLNIKSVKDIENNNYSFANRQAGAGTRLLFDYKLKQSGIEKAKIKGYEKEFTTHLAVAAAVKNGSFDTGLAVKSAANIMDLDFIPVGNEEYDFLVEESFLSDPRLKEFIKYIKSDEFKKKLDETGGYTYDKIGEIILIE